MLIICNALPEISQTKAMDNAFKEAETIATQIARENRDGTSPNEKSRRVFRLGILLSI